MWWKTEPDGKPYWYDEKSGRWEKGWQMGASLLAGIARPKKEPDSGETDKLLPGSKRPSTARPASKVSMPAQRVRGAALVIILGGVLGIIGSMLPWIKVTTAFGSVTRSGMDGGDGILTLILASAGLAAGAARMLDLQLPAFISGSAILDGIVMFGVTLLNYRDVSNRIETFTSEAGGFGVGNVGAGIWVLFVAAVLIAFGGWALLQAEKLEQQSESAED